MMGAKRPSVRTPGAMRPGVNALLVTGLTERVLIERKLDARNVSVTRKKPNVTQLNVARQNAKSLNATMTNAKSLNATTMQSVKTMLNERKKIVRWSNEQLSSATECRDALTRSNSRCAHHCLLQSAEFI
jgi:hypothetical protein